MSWHKEAFKEIEMNEELKKELSQGFFKKYHLINAIKELTEEKKLFDTDDLIKKVLSKHNVVLTRKAILARLSRLAKENIIVREARGLYHYKF